jgi:hypothetical protein
MNDTSGPTLETSLASVALQLSLANKLHQRLDANGSPEFELTWKEWAMPLGAPICALRARARRKSVNGCSGWPAPNALAKNRGGLQANPAKALERREQGHQLNLDDCAVLAGWATPTRQDGNSSRNTTETGQTLTDQALISGAPTMSSLAATENRGVLSPEHSRWLMGFPVGWTSFADMGTL